ncbi:MAG: Holliday junction branch migration protein RuvA [Porcipelethomonas sp.]
MIYSIRGELTHKEPFLAVVECSGIGYACRITCATAAQIGETGSEVFLYTYLYVREDNVELFGFCSKQELHCFKLLISVSGVGPKMALSILSDVDAQRFALTIASGESKVFTKTKGVGPKLAQRIVLELKDKVAKEGISAEDIKASGNVGIPQGDNCDEAITALITLGFSQAEVAEAVSKTDTALPTEKIIKQALKILGGK